MEKLQTKERIIETALSLFRDKGTQNVSVRDICEAAGITRSAFYYHFKEKDEIFKDFYLIPDQFIQENLPSILSLKGFIEQFYAIYDIYYELTIKYGPDVLSQAYYCSMNKGAQTLSPKNIAAFPIYVSLLEQAQAVGEIANLSPAAQLAENAIYLGVGLSVAWCGKNGAFDVVAETHRAFDTLLMRRRNTTE